MDMRVIDKVEPGMEKTESDNIKYYSLKNEYLRGLAFKNGFYRLRDTDYVSDNVSRLNRHPSGVNISFKTNSSRIKIKAELTTKAYMDHMTAIGQIGFDLYYKHENKYVFLASTKVNAKEYDITLVSDLGNEYREYRLYFPLYAEVVEAYLGIESESNLDFLSYKQEKVVIYGTSISQGGSANRPGMSYTNILDRITDYEYINLGFSGSAHLELEMADILNEIEKKYLILEVEANNSHQSLVDNLPAFIDRLVCDKIFLISHFPETINLLKQSYKQITKANYDFQKQINKVIFIDGHSLLAELDYDGTVDGVHLTDLGFYTLAKNLQKYIK